MSRYFKWQLTLRDEDFLKDYWENSRGGDNLASVYWLYNRTGEAFLLELATKIDRVSANWRQVGNLPNWHNVNIAENFHAPAVYGLQSKKPADTRAAYENFDLIRTKFGQVPGGMFGADENARTGYDDPHQATETCGIVEQLGSNLAMAAITADPKWIANSEDVAFNSLPAAFMPDYRALRYLTAPNQVLSDAANHAPGIANDGSFMLMNPFSSRCCQHNHTSGWTNFLESTWMATQDNGLAALIFTEGIVSAKVAGGQIVKVSTKTRYPFEGNIQMKVLTIKSAKFPIYLLIPDWANSPVIKINGAESPVKAGKFVRIDRTWKNGDQIEIKLPMEPRIHEWKKMKNSASVSVGPLTFSLKIGEQYTKIDGLKFTQQDSGWKPGVDQSNWPTHEITPTTEWNFGIQKGSTLSVIRKPWPKNNFPFTHEACPIELQMMGKQIPEWKLDKHGLAGVLPLSPVAVTGPSVPLTLIPMGAARLRISSFPQVK